MKAEDGNVLKIFNSDTQFIVPLYQRMYSWKEEQCSKLWEDIVFLEKHNKKGHFIGSIVCVIESASISGTSKFMVIDGQQRLTTLTILLTALRDYLTSQGIKSSITRKFLKNDTENENDKYKLALTYNDKDVLIKLIENVPIDDVKNSRVLDAYNFFSRQISSSDLTQEQIENAIAKLQIVNIILDPSSDNPQSIFESLNSTGLDLSQSDLIRNYILMGLSNQEQTDLYNKKWMPTEKLFNYEKQSELMDRFFRDYITMKISRIPKEGNVYEEFKKYHQSLNITNMEHCNDIYNYAKCYTNIIFSETNDNELNEIFADIRLLRMEVAYPFLMYVYNDYNNDKITREDFIKILRFTESYVFRRAICEIPTNSLNKTFAVMRNKINANDYVNSICANYILLDSYKEFPKNEEFSQRFVDKDIYHMRIRQYILGKLERYDNKEKLDLGSFTIEHVMPENENLRNGWKEALGKDWQAIHTQYLHTIGNLTLTAYNSEMSDRSFNDKLTMKGGFSDTGLRLNSYIRNQTEWNADKIKERAEILSKNAIQIWKFPSVSEEVLQQYKEKPLKKRSEYTFDIYSDSFSEETLSLYNELDKKIMNLDSSVKREYTKLYIAYKADTNFVDIVPQKNALFITVNIDFDKIHDPEGMCVDYKGKGRWGTGEVGIHIDDVTKIDYVISIISQALNEQLDG